MLMYFVSAEFGKTVTAEPIYDWNCVNNNIADRSSIEIKSVDVCPPRCSMYQDCQDCLEATGAEGGWHECRWSTQLREVCSHCLLLSPLIICHHHPLNSFPNIWLDYCREISSCLFSVILYFFPIFPSLSYILSN